MSSVRPATHAGSWYSADGDSLNRSLQAWLDAVRVGAAPARAVPPPPPIARSPVVSECMGVIAPHAGYRFSGPSAAWAYACVDPAAFDRVFILGPSHRVYLEGCALSGFTELATPLGNLTVDHAANTGLASTGLFKTMTPRIDEDEHSIEMHLPFVRKVFAGGSRFRYTRYTSASGARAIDLTARTPPTVYAARPIYESICELDADAMRAIAFQPSSSAPVRNTCAQDAHAAFVSYLDETENTVCGRNPIVLLLAVLKRSGEPCECAFMHYEQSSACETPSDSSVSYAAAYIRRVGAK
ncbi:hypothetical protein MSPP1_002734 [Malassezia sp. CBS 17886]|nr:hypothetical protein MSPP1_002734 [Malassezia sp. CBS 17886]